MENDLPKNWVETGLMDIASVYTGKKDANFASDNGEYNFFTCAYEPLKADSYSFEGDVLILPGNGANVGEVFYYSGKFEAYQRTYIIDEIRIDSKYLFYYFRGFWRISGVSEQYGSATNYIKIGNFKNFRISVPPLPEQTRIVAKLEQLFGQLELIKESLDKIPQLLKDFRQKVLTQAVTGKLTEEWREGKSLANWTRSSIGEFMIEIKDKADPQLIPSTKYIGLEYIEKDGGIIKIGISDDLKSNKTVFKAGDVLYGKLRPYLNKHDVVTFDGICSTDILVYRNDNLESAKFFNYYLGLNKTIEKLNAEAKGINLPRVSSKILNDFRISIPSLQEQQEIVTRVEVLFTKAFTIEQQYQTLKQKIDTLPQAILHKAFKGELVPQLESDGDAQKLLEEIKALKKQVAKPNVRVSAVEPSKKANPNVRVSAVEPLKKTKANKVDDVELGRVAEEIKKYK